MVKRLVGLLLAATLLALPAAASQEWTVCEVVGACDFWTIQTAVDSAATVAGDTITVWADTVGGSKTFTESIDASADDDILLRARSGDTITINPEGVTEITDAFGLGYSTSDGPGWIVDGFHFSSSDSTSLNTGIYYNVDATLTVQNCTFSGLRVGIYNRSSVGTALITITNCDFSAPQTVGVSGAAGFITARVSNWAISGCTFNAVGWTPDGTQLRQVLIDDAASFSLTNCTFVGDDNDDGEIIGSLDLNTNTTISHNSFSGGESGQIQFNIGSLVGEFDTNVVIEHNTFTNPPANAIQFLMNAGATQYQLHRNVVIRGNTITYGGVVGSGILLAGVAGGDVSGNKIYGYSPSDCSAIQLASCRFVNVHHNEFYDADNGVVVSANTSMTNFGQFGCSITDNLFSGDGDDGSIKIDNYNGVAADVQDSSMTIAGNVFVNVAVIGAMVNTSNTTDSAEELPEWLSDLAALPNILGNGIGAVNDPSALGLYKKLGIIPGHRPRGTVGPRY